MSAVSKVQKSVLTAFADHGAPASLWERFGDGVPHAAADAVHALVKAGLLAALPYTEGADDHNGTRFRVTADGYRELGRAVPPPQMAHVKAAKSHGARVVASLNGLHHKAG